LFIICIFNYFNSIINFYELFNSFLIVFIGLVLFSQTFWAPVDKILTLIMNFNSRYNEFAADKYAYDLGITILNYMKNFISSLLSNNFFTNIIIIIIII
jgi:Zn-dependent protease with chaperone function